jgi:hypothetical protein
MDVATQARVHTLLPFPRKLLTFTPMNTPQYPPADQLLVIYFKVNGHEYCFVNPNLGGARGVDCDAVGPQLLLDLTAGRVYTLVERSGEFAPVTLCFCSLGSASIFCGFVGQHHVRYYQNFSASTFKEGLVPSLALGAPHFFDEPPAVFAVKIVSSTTTIFRSNKMDNRPSRIVELFPEDTEHLNGVVDTRAVDNDDFVIVGQNDLEDDASKAYTVEVDDYLLVISK